ncbi:hypothetical protein ACQKJG_17830 [Priestia megaterium]|uniref:hypothetical protein n=1 Tax=Priestia megaterium TaxID=1404 RepID=UPI003D025FE7
MSFDKLIPSRITEYKIFDVSSEDELVKEASDVDFPEGFVYDPDFLYMWVRIVSSGEFYGPNKNGDYFPNDQLEAYFSTFNDGHPFKNHENKKVENAIGKIISVRWNPVMRCVEILKGIDKKRSPETARGYLKGYLTDVSMGCKVPYTECSICGNKARKKSEFCDHVRKYRLQFLGNGERVFEINYKPRFHDSSTVLNGAERVAKAFFIVDTPPKGTATTSFRKVASDSSTLHYVYDEAMEKVAHTEETVHPLFKVAATKQANMDNEMMRKIAEFEKQVTGKLINIISGKKQSDLPHAAEMLQVIKFLTEKRLDDASLITVANSVKSVAKANNIPITRAFSTLLGVAELMGITFFPGELDTLLKHMTDAHLNRDLDVASEQEGNVYPSEFATGISKAVQDIEDAPDFHDPSSLFDLYQRATFDTDGFNRNRDNFLSNVDVGSELNQDAPVRVIRIIRSTLEPMMKMRSSHPDHLYPRLSVVLNGHRAVIGNEDVRRDLNMIAHPSSIGEALGGLAYGLYERMRPSFGQTRIIKLAADTFDGMDKTAAPDFESRDERREYKEQKRQKYQPREKIGLNPDYKKKPGIGKTKLMMATVPIAYGASAYQKSRENNGRYLTDGQNFMKEHPFIVGAGAALAGAPLTRAVATGARKAKSVGGNVFQTIKKPFTKEADFDQFESLVKVADDLTSGDYNVFDNKKVLTDYMDQTGANEEQTSAVKMATILSLGGMDKEAFAILDHYNIPSGEKGRMLKIASDHVEGELDKVAEEFTNNMLLSAIGDVSPLSRTLPGRAVDALVFKKLSDMGKPKEQTAPKPNEGGNPNV